MFVNFRVFIQKEFGKQHKQNKTTAKSVGYGIANSITDKYFRPDQAARGTGPIRCRVGKQHARAKPEAIQGNDGSVQSNVREKLTFSDQPQESKVVSGQEEKEVPTLWDGGVSQARGMFRT